ncbi:tetratricopeptide repeat protein [Aureisphaera galaxeae]|uniref:tetratricopeptide repeat protein n=1 Tax=Aureisphaera galaxeae TaxID=1538023 RepID=UPI002350598A|nr:tetratricopeptide repeat protein [Aureisphaera galaxeae]MDC8005296.1 tetratricopeptide repeat protein [Aureisphaera galaxeae]
MKKAIYILILLVSVLGTAQNEALFEQGKQQYKAEKYQEAITNWNKILQSGEHSAALYYNIGNAHYRLNEIGPSIYYYEKALQLSPNDKEILNNLAYAQNATVDAIEPLPQTVFAKWDKSVSSLLTFEGWAWVSVICALLFALLFITYYFSMYSRQKRVLFVGALLTLFVLITGVSMSFRNFGKQLKDKPAIIFAESTEVKSDPKMNSETSFLLHEGTKVQILAEDGDWSRIQIADGKDGWVLNSDFKTL